MVFALALVFLLRVMAGLFASGTLLPSDSTGFAALAAAWAGVSLLALLLLRLFRWGCGTVFTAIFFWTVGYVAIWQLGDYTGGISLPIYLGFWIGAAALMALLWTPFRPRANALPAAAVSPVPVSTVLGVTTRLQPPRTPRQVMHRSDFGRIPAETLALVMSQAHTVTTEVVGVLPPGTPGDIRDLTIREVLRRTLRDWWENGNTEGIPSQDSADLCSFVALASALAGDWRTAGSWVIYRATLVALLDDWLLAWNADGVDGPPRRG